MLNLVDLRKQFQENGVLFIYNGYLTHDILTNIIQALEQKIGTIKIFNYSAQNVFTVLIEIIQNILNYHAVLPNESSKGISCEGIVVVGFDQKKGRIFINSGNVVTEEDGQKIRDRIDAIANLNKDELKSRYRDLRKTGKNRSARGAGLGFMEIQRKASEPIQYSFDATEGNHLLFTLNVYL